MRPSAKATQPRSITRSASTIRALPMTVSVLVAFISSVFLHAASCRRGKGGDVDDPVCDQSPDLIVMHDRNHGHARPLLLVDQANNHLAVGGVPRSGRLIQPPHRLLRKQ